MKSPSILTNGKLNGRILALIRTKSRLSPGHGGKLTNDQLAAVGAFLSGAGSVITAWFYVRWQRKEWEKECNQRLESFKAGLHEMEDHEEDS